MRITLCKSGKEDHVWVCRRLAQWTASIFYVVMHTLSFSVRMQHIKTLFLYDTIMSKGKQYSLEFLNDGSWRPENRIHQAQPCPSPNIIIWEESRVLIWFSDNSLWPNGDQGQLHINFHKVAFPNIFAFGEYIKEFYIFWPMLTLNDFAMSWGVIDYHLFSMQETSFFW